ncbi:MAG: hypothetical protein AAF471_07445 [Myxococcota bacterium]
MKPSYGMWLVLAAYLSACGGQYNLDLLAQQVELGRSLTQEASDGNLPAYAATAAAAQSAEQLAGVRELQDSLAAKHRHIVLSGGPGADSLVYVEALAALTAPVKQESPPQPPQQGLARATPQEGQPQVASDQPKPQSQKRLTGWTVVRVEMEDFVNRARELSVTPSQFLELLQRGVARSGQEHSSPVFVVVVQEVPGLDDVRRFSGFARDGLLEAEFDRKLLDAVGSAGYPVIWVLGQSKKQSVRPLHEMLRHQPRIEVGDLSATQLYMLLHGEKKGRGILLADDLLRMIVRVLSVHGGSQGLLELGLRVMNAVSEELERNPKMTWQDQRELCLRVLAPLLRTTVGALEQSRAVTWTGTLQEFASDQLRDPSAHQLIKLGPGELASLKVKLRTTILRTSQNLRRLLLNLSGSVSDALIQTIRGDLKTIDGAVQDILPTLSKSSSEDRSIARLTASSLRDLADEFDKDDNGSIKERVADEVDRLKTANIAKLNSFVQ